MPTIKISDESFEKDVLQNSKPVLIDFWAPWCNPCLQVAPILEEISDEMKDKIVVAKHNIDDHPNQASRFGVRGIPTMLLFKDSELKATKVGATTKSNIVKWIEENI
jgi:thioredoxin 1